MEEVDWRFKWEYGGDCELVGRGGSSGYGSYEVVSGG